MLNLPVHGPARPRPAHPLLQAAPVRREPLSPDRHHLLILIAVRQADTFLRARGISLEAATRADLEAFVGVQLGQGVLGPGRVQGWLRRVFEQREVSRTACTPLGSPDW